MTKGNKSGHAATDDAATAVRSPTALVALKHITSELASYELENHRPTKDELFSLLYHAMVGASDPFLLAAPDILAALKHCVIERSEWLDEARAAIAKAEGR